jgi:hypothetical protein
MDVSVVDLDTVMTGSSVPTDGLISCVLASQIMVFSRFLMMQLESLLMSTSLSDIVANFISFLLKQ